MASYSQFLGRQVTVQYRVGDVLLPASGWFSADSGRSIFLEQHVEQRGKLSYFRWEIPYQFILRIEETPEPANAPSAESTDSSAESAQIPRASAARAAATGGSSMLPSAQRPKTA
jgi:hypothetical protein